MPEIPTQLTTAISFTKPIPRAPLSGVEADPNCDVRFGYNVLPEGSGCIRVRPENLPQAVLDYFLGLAKEQELAKAP